MDFEKRDFIYCVVAMICGALMILLVFLIKNKIYEYNCDHIPITEAWKDTKCVEYFHRTSGD